MLFPVDIFQTNNTEELSIFKRLVLELDKISCEYGYDDFKTFYSKKTNNAKAIQLLLKITAIFGQVLAKKQKVNVEFSSLIDSPIPYENSILKAQMNSTCMLFFITLQLSTLVLLIY